MWDAGQYHKFSAERARPFADLMAQVHASAPATIVDLGCGTGNLTETLAERWPSAQVLGVDSSPEMLAKALPRSIPCRLDFVQADINQWMPRVPADLIVSNAALQWVEGHDRLIDRLVEMLSGSGMLAVQMPKRFDTPTQDAIEQTVADLRWESTLKGVGLHRDSVAPISWYVERLCDRGFRVNAWETTYQHVLTGENPILEWLRGTALRPHLERLAPDQVPQFEAALGGRLKIAYPARNGMTLFPFPRLFFVASRR